MRHFCNDEGFGVIRISVVLLLWCSILALTACSGPSSAPRSKVLHTPANQHLKGWQKPYVVDGKQYNPLRDHQGFVQEGIASWYGKKFHGRKTSNGEIYNMYAMTAAHKTLPLGIFVRVTHLNTGRQVIVRVNDRGPFVAGRVIDLSYSAAQQMGIVGPGTGPVRVEALGYRQTDAAGKVAYQAPKSYDVGSYAIQVGAFSVKTNADRLAAKLRARYGVARVQKGWHGTGSIYRVWVGNHSSLEAAEQAKIELTGNGFGGSFIVAFDG